MTTNSSISVKPFVRTIAIDLPFNNLLIQSSRSPFISFQF
jgi:hypothetical protein